MRGNFGVLVFDDALRHLEPFADLLKKSGDNHYFLAKQVDPSGTYLHMVIEDPDPSDQVADIDLYIPHHAVRAIVRMNDLGRFGFL
jgi:hypothetical protein